MIESIVKLSLRIFRAVVMFVWSLVSTSTSETVMVPMPDGVRLATDYYLPRGKGPFPVILIRTPYGKGGEAAKMIATRFNSKGFACVIQDTRGSSGSEGRYMGFADDGWGEHQDGVNTLRWIRQQPWCNGKVATWGPSALGITQVLLAGTGEDITCQYIAVAASNFYGQASYQGGVFRKNLAEEWLKDREAPHVIDIWKEHPTYDSFWTYYNAESRAHLVRAPAIHHGGWFDIFAQGTINNFVSRQYHGGEGARGNQKLIMGPWPHGVVQEFGELRFPDNYNFDIVSYQMRFLNYWLKGEDNGIMDEPAVHYYTMGDCDDPNAPGNEWRTADDWPPFPTEERAYYLTEDGGLTTDLSNVSDGQLSYDYDPEDPCPTHGGANLGLASIEIGPFDQRALADRPDVLTFSTPVLEKPIEVTGAIRLKLYVSSNAPDTDFTAKFLDIYPDGRQILMTDNIQRLKFRNGFEKPDPLPPGTIGELEIDLWSISLVFNRGHRIGVQISSSNYPRFERNPNTGEDFPREGHTRVAHNTIYMGPKHPSALILPVRPTE